MRASPNLEAGGGLGARFVLEAEGGAMWRGAVAISRAWTRKLVDHELLLEAARSEDLWASLAREGDGADNVVVLEGVKTFACMSVPDFAGTRVLVRYRKCKTYDLR